MLSKATAIAAVLFMVISIWLGIEQGYVGGSAGGSGSVLESSGVAGETAPAPAAMPLPAGANIDIEPVTPAEAPAEAPAQ
jgi:hypothetical protein